ncbi:S8 family peptidase [Vallitalea okinawensis]|uniref:S8 family peptidase n=1 Tax=Vallitalea okinawensis TaxID=2078660 RepID=UPI000CFB9C99|nr:S8 family peptidase [Vallitalea okinawensis]
MKSYDFDKRQNCHEIIISEEYIDIYQRSTIGIDEIKEIAEELNVECFQQLAPNDWVLHVKVEEKDLESFFETTPHIILPNIYGLTSSESIEAAGISAILDNKSLEISGEGTVIGILDTGIDYTHEAFRFDEKRSKIIAIWDQSIAGNSPEGFLYGTEYTNEEINHALQSENPLSIVSSTDDIGHGTFLAGIAAGMPNNEENFQGAAPGAELVIVKLKQAKKNVIDYFQVKEDAVAFQTNDIIQGLNYLKSKAKEFKKPLVVLFTGASNEGPHNGSAFLEKELEYYGNFFGVVSVVSAGNETGASKHYHGRFRDDEERINISLNIAEEERGLFFNVWCGLPDELTIELITPSGETTGKVPFVSDEWQEIEVLLESTKILIYYEFIEERGGEEAIYVRILNPLPGLWTIVIHGDIVINGEFDIWLPVKGFIDDLTVFMQPNPNTTIVNPGTNVGTITVGAYNVAANSIYLPSSRGYTKDNRIKPDIVAPGVNVIGPYPNNVYGLYSGTSVSAAITAGASALLLEWGIVKGNDPLLNTVAVKTYLARGARRKEMLLYPNREWGYGELDLFNSYMVIGMKL